MLPGLRLNPVNFAQRATIQAHSYSCFIWVNVMLGYLKDGVCGQEGGQVEGRAHEARLKCVRRMNEVSYEGFVKIDDICLRPRRYVCVLVCVCVCMSVCVCLCLCVCV